MGYKLTTAGTFSLTDPTDADIRRAFDSDAERGEFIILEASDGGFIQASGEGQGPYSLEYRTAAGLHWVANGHLMKAEVQDAFLGFLKSDNAWQTGRVWTPLAKKKAGCLAVAAAMLLLLVAIYA